MVARRSIEYNIYSLRVDVYLIHIFDLFDWRWPLSLGKTMNGTILHLCLQKYNSRSLVLFVHTVSHLYHLLRCRFNVITIVLAMGAAVVARRSIEYNIYSLRVDVFLIHIFDLFDWRWPLSLRKTMNGTILHLCLQKYKQRFLVLFVHTVSHLYHLLRCRFNVITIVLAMGAAVVARRSIVYNIYSLRVDVYLIHIFDLFDWRWPLSLGKTMNGTILHLCLQKYNSRSLVLFVHTVSHLYHLLRCRFNVITIVLAMGAAVVARRSIEYNIYSLRVDVYLIHIFDLFDWRWPLSLGKTMNGTILHLCLQKYKQRSLVLFVHTVSHLYHLLRCRFNVITIVLAMGAAVVARRSIEYNIYSLRVDVYLIHIFDLFDWRWPLSLGKTMNGTILHLCLQKYKQRSLVLFVHTVSHLYHLLRCRFNVITIVLAMGAAVVARRSIEYNIHLFFL